MKRTPKPKLSSVGAPHSSHFVVTFTFTFVIEPLLLNDKTKQQREQSMMPLSLMIDRGRVEKRWLGGSFRKFSVSGNQAKSC